MCQFSIRKLKGVLLNACLPGSKLNAQHTACQLCLTEAFYFASLCPLPPSTAGSAAASVPLEQLHTRPVDAGEAKMEVLLILHFWRER